MTTRIPEIEIQPPIESYAGDRAALCNKVLTAAARHTHLIVQFACIMLGDESEERQKLLKPLITGAITTYVIYRTNPVKGVCDTKNAVEAKFNDIAKGIKKGEAEGSEADLLAIAKRIVLEVDTTIDRNFIVRGGRS